MTKCSTDNITLYNRPDEAWHVDSEGEPTTLIDRAYSNDSSFLWECTNYDAHPEIVEMHEPSEVKQHLGGK